MYGASGVVAAADSAGVQDSVGVHDAVAADVLKAETDRV